MPSSATWKTRSPQQRPRAAARPRARPRPAALSGWALRLQRLLAYSRNETIQILRDPVRLAFAFAGSALLMLVFGFGITTDVEHIRYAVIDRDQTPESRAYTEQFRGTPKYFQRTPALFSDDEGL